MNQANNLFNSNYFVSAVINKNANDPTCVIQPGQSVGSKYSDLVSTTPTVGSVSSICHNDYGVALDNVSQWVKRSMRNLYLLPDVDPSKHEIVDIWLIRAGNRMLITNQCAITGATVKILDQTLLQPGDQFAYRVRNK